MKRSDGSERAAFSGGSDAVGQIETLEAFFLFSLIFVVKSQRFPSHDEEAHGPRAAHIFFRC